MSSANASAHDSAPSVMAEAATRRALIVAPTPFFGDRGCHVRIYEEVRALARLGVQSEVVTYPFGNEIDGVTTRRGRRVPGVREQAVGPSYGRVFLDASLTAAALRAARHLKPHVVHAHLHEGIAIGAVVRARLGVPLVADLQGSLTAELVDHGFFGPTGAMPATARRAERWLVGLPDAVLASSRATATLLESQGVDRARVTYLPDGVDLDQFRPSAPDPELTRALGLEGRRVVVFLGLLTAYQGVDLLLESATEVVRRVPDAHFLIMGYPNEDAYRRRAQALGLARHVTLTGRIPYDQAARYLTLGQLAVSPKRSLTEANGKLLNYMACGLATVATDTPVNRDLLGPSGVYVPVDDARALAATLAEMLQDPVRLGQVGAALRRRAETEYAWPALARTVLTVYDTVTAERAARR